jgi:hypothetical protein
MESIPDYDNYDDDDDDYNDGDHDGDYYYYDNYDDVRVDDALVNDDDVIDHMYEKFKEIQEYYERIIATEPLKNYDWYITVQKTDIDFCSKTIYPYLHNNHGSYHVPNGLFFSPNLVNSEKRPWTANWINFVLDDKYRLNDYYPDKTIITCVGVNKNNIFTYKNGEITISDPCDKTPATNFTKKIYLINSFDSLKYITNMYADTVRPIDWTKFYRDYDGIILNFRNLSFDYEDKYLWFTNWSCDQLVVKDNLRYDKCIKISEKGKLIPYDFTAEKNSEIRVETDYEEEGYDEHKEVENNYVHIETSAYYDDADAMYKKFERIQQHYQSIITYDSLKKYDWYVTIHSENIDLCSKTPYLQFNMETVYTDEPNELIFLKNFSNTEKKNWIRYFLTEEYDLNTYHPDFNFITAIGINKNNIFTYEDDLDIADPCDETPPTDYRKKIYLLNSISTLMNITDTYKTYDLAKDKIDLTEFFSEWKGIILDFDKLMEDYNTNMHASKKMKYSWWKKWKCSQLILKDNFSYDKCIKISEHGKLIPYDPSIKLSDDEYKKKYLKYKNKYLSLKKIL